MRQWARKGRRPVLGQRPPVDQVSALESNGILLDSRCHERLFSGGHHQRTSPTPSASSSAPAPASSDDEAIGSRGRHGHDCDAPLPAHYAAAMPIGTGANRRRRIDLKSHWPLARRQLALALLSLWAALLISGGPLATSGRETRPAGSLQAATDFERQLQLMRSANVELSRRSLQRNQRQTAEGSSQAPGGGTSGAEAPQRAASCGYPGSPAHASVTFNTSQVVVGTAASYTCDNGYELLGPPRRICQANGSWSPIGIPFCGKFSSVRFSSLHSRASCAIRPHLKSSVS